MREQVHRRTLREDLGQVHQVAAPRGHPPVVDTAWNTLNQATDTLARNIRNGPG